MQPRSTSFLPRGLAAVAATLAALLNLATPAWAADPVQGAQRYAESCASCHGTSPLTSNVDRIYYGRNSASAIDSSISSVGDMNSLRSAFPAGSAQIADIAAYLGNTPSSLNFPTTNAGATSAAQSVTVMASLKSGRSITNLVISTTGDYRRSGGTCGTTVNTGTSCTVLVVFEPTTGGVRSGSLRVAHSQLPTPAVINLTGSGAAAAEPKATVSPTSLSFASTAVGLTSAARQATLTNTGNAQLTLGTLTSTSTQFILAGGSCVSGAKLAAGAACTISMQFKPTATGARTGTLNITHNATGSPSKVSLSGTATAAVPLATLAPTSWAFANQVINTSSAGKNIKLSNTGSAGLNIGTISISNKQFKLSGGSCVANTTLAAGASCNIGVKFKPTSTGNKSATLTVAHNAAGSPGTVALTGKGVAALAAVAEPMAASAVRSSPAAFDASAGPLIALDNSVLAVGGTEQVLTVSNRGSTALRLQGLHVVGDAAADFMLSGACTGLDILAPGDSCALAVSQQPGAGERSATLNIVSNAVNGHAAVSLKGLSAKQTAAGTQPKGNALAASAAKSETRLSWLNLGARGVDFGTVSAGKQAEHTTLWLNNRGPRAVTLDALQLQGDAADEFTLLAGGSCTAGLRLAQGGTCSVLLGFNPAAPGLRVAELEVAADVGAPAPVTLSGRGNAVAAGMLKLSPARLDLSGQEPQTVTLRNEGQAVLQVQRVAVAAGGFALSAKGAEACDGEAFALMPGQSCQVQVSASRAMESRTAADTAADTGALEVSTDASDTPVQVALSSQPASDDLAQAVPALEGGGCSIARGDTAADPVLWLLVLAAAGVLWHRRRRA